jgi:hypothetical protein
MPQSAEATACSNQTQGCVRLSSPRAGVLCNPCCGLQCSSWVEGLDVVVLDGPIDGPGQDGVPLPGRVDSDTCLQVGLSDPVVRGEQHAPRFAECVWEPDELQSARFVPGCARSCWQRRRWQPTALGVGCRSGSHSASPAPNSRDRLNGRPHRLPAREAREHDPGKRDYWAARLAAVSSNPDVRTRSSRLRTVCSLRASVRAWNPPKLSQFQPQPPTVLTRCLSTSRVGLPPQRCSCS